MEFSNNETMSSRRKARIVALQILYEMDSTGHPHSEIMERALHDKDMDRRGLEFTKILVDGVIQELEDLDKRIEQFATIWPVDQLSIVDRNILRIALYEIFWDTEVPSKVAINEAVELAKKFGSQNSFKFINELSNSLRDDAGNSIKFYFKEHGWTI